VKRKTHAGDAVAATDAKAMGTFLEKIVADFKELLPPMEAGGAETEKGKTGASGELTSVEEDFM
jgi:hypothetical protein